MGPLPPLPDEEVDVGEAVAEALGGLVVVADMAYHSA